jgi:tetratricopeptide (TPR) repeat protein
MTSQTHIKFVQLLAAVCINLSLPSAQAAPERAAAQADVEKIQDQVHALDKDVAVFIAKLDAQDKRLQDIQSITANQANHIAMVANQTTVLGNWIAWTSAIITILVFFAGFISFRQKDKAIEEARRASKEEAEVAAKEWFESHSKELKNVIEKLKAEITSLKHQAKEEIENNVREVSAATAAAIQVIEDDSNKSPTDLSQADLATKVDALKSKAEAGFSAQDYFNKGSLEYGNSRFEIALEAFTNAIDALARETDAEDTTRAKYLFRKALTLGRLNRNEDAITVYDLIVQRYSSDSSPVLREQVAKALFNKAVRLGKLNRSEDAIAVYDLIVQRYSPDTSNALREQVAKALINKILTLVQLDRSEDAIAVSDLIDQRFSSDTSPALREQVAKALLNKGVRLGKLNRIEDAIAVYDIIVQRYSSDTSPALNEQVAKALINKAITIGQLDKSEEAIAVYDLIDQRFKSDTSHALRELVAKALLNKGFRLGKLNRSEDAVDVYDLIDQRYSSDTSPALRELVANALFNKGFRLGKLNRREESIAVYDLIEQRYSSDRTSAVQEIVTKARNARQRLK